MGRTFTKGALGSPFSTEYYGNEGIEMGPGGRPSEGGPKIGSGVLGRRVEMEVQRDNDGPKRGRGRMRRGSTED